MKCIIHPRTDGGVSRTTVSTRALASLIQGGLTEGAAFDMLANQARPTNALGPHFVVEEITLSPHLRGPSAEDRYFRDACAWGGSDVVVDMPKARVIHMGRLRLARDKALVAQDTLYMKAFESGDIAEQTRITNLKQRLRDLPQTFILSIFPTPEALKAAWPPELPPRTPV